MTIDPNEAPEGYYAVLINSLSEKERSVNICRSCDWRPECQKIECRTEHYQRCSSITTISFQDRRELKRNDGCAVVFKKRPAK